MDVFEERVTDDVFELISSALSSWIKSLSFLEERTQIITSVEEQIERTLLQVQGEGELSIYAFETLHYIGKLWVSLMQLLMNKLNEANKKAIIKHLMELKDMEQINETVFIDIILKL